MDVIARIHPNSGNAERIEKELNSLTDKQFEAFMKELSEGDRTLRISAPNLSANKLSVKRNIKIAKELGYDFFQPLVLTDPATGLTFKTKEKYLILSLPFRRQAQHLTKKMSVPQDNDSRDDLTGQPTGKSKGSSVSNPETQVLYALGLDYAIEELIKHRGGDQTSYLAMNKYIHETGGFSLEQVKKLGGKVKSSDTLSEYFVGAGYANNLNE